MNLNKCVAYSMLPLEHMLSQQSATISGYNTTKHSFNRNKGMLDLDLFSSRESFDQYVYELLMYLLYKCLFIFTDLATSIKLTQQFLSYKPIQTIKKTWPLLHIYNSI